MVNVETKNTEIEFQIFSPNFFSNILSILKNS